MIVYERAPIANFRLFELENEGANMQWVDLLEFLSIFNKNGSYPRAPDSAKKICEATNCDLAMWPAVIPKNVRTSAIEQIKKDVENIMQAQHGYFSHWAEMRSFLSSLSEFAIDRPKFNSLVNTKNNRPELLRVPVRYSTSSTTTGRLTITEGPNFLVLPKQARKCILRGFSNSAIYSIDFTSLEPRVMLHATSRPAKSEDIYQDIMHLCEITDRDAAKLATLSTLYGAGARRLGSMLKDHKLAKVLLSKVSEYFGVKQLNASLTSQARNGAVTNMFGRPLFEATLQARLRINHFVQSTAAELAILLFAKLCKEFTAVRPLLIIHDALIVEVPESCSRSFLQAANKLYYDDTWFPTKCERLDI